MAILHNYKVHNVLFHRVPQSLLMLLAACAQIIFKENQREISVTTPISSKHRRICTVRRKVHKHGKLLKKKYHWQQQTNKIKQKRRDKEKTKSLKETYERRCSKAEYNSGVLPFEERKFMHKEKWRFAKRAENRLSQRTWSMSQTETHPDKLDIQDSILSWKIIDNKWSQGATACGWKQR